jgi:hydrogenase large subunit
VEAVEAAFGVTVSPNAVLLRNLVQAAGLVSDHILHFYHLALLDYVHGPRFPPYTPAYAVDQRFSDAEADAFANDYMLALEMRKIAHELAAIFAGKLPHVMTFAAGGVTQQPTAENVATFRSLLDELQPFVDGVYLPARYPEYQRIGAGPANLLSFGAFPDADGNLLFASGRLWEPGHAKRPEHLGVGERPRPRRLDALTPADVAAIDESVKHAWYDDPKACRPGVASAPTPDLDKAGAYSWVKAPRLGGDVYQVGALARLQVDGTYAGGLSVMDRLLANALETSRVTGAMRGWLDALALAGSGYQHVATMPATGSACALTEAPRGSLAHWLEYQDGRVTAYRIVTPTAWNASPRDDREAPGPMEQALVGVEIADRSQPVELYRVIHSFDPCMGCAVHVTLIDE